MKLTFEAGGFVCGAAQLTYGAGGFTYGAPDLNYGAEARNFSLSKQNLQAHEPNLQGGSNLFILSSLPIPEPPVPQVLRRLIPAAV